MIGGDLPHEINAGVIMRHKLRDPFRQEKTSFVIVALPAADEDSRAVSPFWRDVVIRWRSPSRQF